MARLGSWCASPGACRRCARRSARQGARRGRSEGAQGTGEGEPPGLNKIEKLSEAYRDLKVALHNAAALAESRRQKHVLDSREEVRELGLRDGFMKALEMVTEVFK